MKKYIIECRYCGNIWRQEIETQRALDALMCHCGESRDFKTQKVETSDIFGYRFSPPFPEDNILHDQSEEYPTDLESFYYLNNYVNLD